MLSRLPSDLMRDRLRCLALSLACVLHAGCNEPFSWQRLIASKIAYEFPTYRVDQLADGRLLVHRPGLPDATVDVEPIGKLCQRGPKDCSYATDQMLVELRGP
jgi:hypothetical protein